MKGLKNPINIGINNIVAGASKWDTVASLALDVGDLFDEVNVATAVHRLAKLSGPPDVSAPSTPLSTPAPDLPGACTHSSGDAEVQLRNPLGAARRAAECPATLAALTFPGGPGANRAGEPERGQRPWLKRQGRAGGGGSPLTSLLSGSRPPAWPRALGA